MTASVKTMKTTTFKGGAKRAVVEEAFELLCPTAELALTAIYAEGAKNYGTRNWTKGLPKDVIIRHLRRHLNLWQRGDRSEDHMAKVAWGAFAIIHYEQNCTCGEQGESA